jgi:ribosomal protein L11 methylase PrmA
MIKLAGIGKDDVVYDLGCGDGRMVIAAVKQGGAKKGIGVDIDPQRVKEAKENVQKEGVADKVEIREGDALKVKDLSDATVVLLYMGNEFDLLLRPILEKQLKPGARIVSHRFTMGDWKPEKTETLTGKDGDRYLIHLWRIEKK